MAQTFNAMGWQDRTVKVRRGELLGVLKSNREKHVREYQEACQGYRAVALERIEQVFGDLKGTIENLKDGRMVALVNLNFGLPVPVSHEKAYDQIIRMMEMSVDDVIELTASQFAAFVMDDWDWRQNWASSNTGYLEKARGG